MINFCKENKRLLIFSFLSMLFVHLIKFVNYYPNWDSIFGVYKYMAGMSDFGRWLSGVITNFLASPYDLQWVEAIIATTFISFTLVFFLKIFNITNTKLQYLSILLFVTFPCTAATLNYPHWIPSYYCGLFLTVLAVYICIQNKWNKYLTYIVSSCLFTIGLAAYQIYFLFAILICIFYLFTKLLTKNSLHEEKEIIRNFIVSLIGGALLYGITTKIVLHFLGVQLDSYQGIAFIHFPNISDIFYGIGQSFTSFYKFFFGNYSLIEGEFNFFSLYPIINSVILVLFIICIIKFVVLNKKLSTLNRVILCLMILLLIPVGYSYYFISRGVNYHTLMQYGVYFVYFIPIIILQNCNFSFIKFKKLVIIFLCAITCYNFVNANVAYHQLSISYEKTYFQNVEIAMKIDEATNSKDKTVAIIGRFQDSGNNLSANPSIEGAGTTITTWSHTHILIFLNFYLGRSYGWCEQEKIDEIKEMKEFKEMEDFPSKNSVKVIDGIVVVRLSEYED